MVFAVESDFHFFPDINKRWPRRSFRYDRPLKITSMRNEGKITSWNDEKGFGFITPAAGGKRVFVHIKAFSNRKRRPEINQSVSYTLSTDRQGRACAVAATLAGDRLPQKEMRKVAWLPIFVAVFFLVIVGFSVFAYKISPLIFALYMVASLLTFMMYAVDKSAARKGAWRTRESTLHLMALAGGWPGALLAQRMLRHKSRKQPFRSVFRATVLLNCGAFVWLFTPTGAATLQSLIASFEQGIGVVGNSVINR